MSVGTKHQVVKTISMWDSSTKSQTYFLTAMDQITHLRMFSISSFYGSSCANNGKGALNTQRPFPT